jgi:glycosyltransferase involved in cell wall biosynthesis
MDLNTNSGDFLFFSPYYNKRRILIKNNSYNQKMKTAKDITICIPTHEMGGLGVTFLAKSFNILINQSFKNFDIVVSDHSKNDEIKNLCESHKEKLNIHYYRNTEKIGSSSANINNAITKASGQLIKILFLDDFLYTDKSLEEIIENFDLEKDNWLITACEHSKDGKTFYRPFYPKYNKYIYLGKNTISSPSVLTIKNDSPLLFDENLVWLMDCDYYKRCYDKFGSPKILNKINVVNTTGEHQGVGGYKNKDKKATNLTKKNELLYILKKYKHTVLFIKFSLFFNDLKSLIKNLIHK